MPWIDAQWLFQVVLYFFYEALGFSGLTVLKAVFILAVCALLAFAVPGRPPVGVRAAALLFFLIAINPRLKCRPEMITFACMSAEFFFLERARAGNPRMLIGVPLVHIVQVNVEGLWPIGIALAGTYMGDVAIETVRREGLKQLVPALRPWMAALAAMAVVSFFQPYGLEGVVFPLTLLKAVVMKGMQHKQFIREFQPIFPFSSPLSVICMPFVFFGAAALLCGALCGRSIRPALLALAAFFFALAVISNRNLGVASIVLMQTLTVHLSILAGKRKSWFANELAIKWTAILTIIIALFLTILSSAPRKRFWDNIYRRPGFGINLDTRAYPIQAANYLKSIGYKGNIINNPELGGYLIWAGWPQWRVFADTRLEVGSGTELQYYQEVFEDPEKMDRLSRTDEAYAVVMSHHGAFGDRFLTLLNDRRWALTHLDYTAAVFLKRGTRFDEIIQRDQIKDPLHYEFGLPSQQIRP
jgi:hypothetical protein